jgi:o-succinylbenzoate synthase
MNVDPFALDLASPLATARGEITEREGFVVRLAVDGTTGVGEAAPLPGWTESLADCEAALDNCGGALEAVAASDEASPVDHRALADAPAARHAVASAVLDARARAAGEPLYRVLADDGLPTPGPVESIPVNATVGDGSPEEAADAAADAVGDGFGTVKLKVGARPVTADAERVAAVRDRCPDVALRADANGAWTRDEAERALAAFAEHEVAYVEQPLPADATLVDGTRRDLRAHAELRGAGVGVALDESLAVGEEPVAAALDAGAADALVLKPMALGGPDRALAAAHAAQAAGIEAVLTTTIDGALARATAVHAAAAVPDVPACGLATGDRLARDLLATDPTPVSDGRARVPGGPGVAGATRWHRGRTDRA